jgi:hypothetical protein
MVLLKFGDGVLSLCSFSGCLGFVSLGVDELNFKVLKLLFFVVERFFDLIDSKSIVLIEDFIVKIFEDIEFIFEDTGGLLTEYFLSVTLS